MYCSIAKREMKRRTQNNPRPSGVYKNPKWKHKNNGSQGYELGGEEIVRNLKDKWRLSLYEPSNKNGNKKQWYVCTIGYWDIVDDRYGKDKNNLSGQIRDRLKTIFPEMSESEIDTLCNIIAQKFAPIRESIFKEYQDSEEYYYRLIQELIEQKKREYEVGQKIGLRQPPRLPIPDNKDIALQIIHAGYKKIAPKYHPDTGGDTEMMRQLNEVKERLLHASLSLFQN